MVTGLSLIAEGVEDEAVRAQLFFGKAVVTFVVLVTLSAVLKSAVGFGTVELAWEKQTQGS